jgi:hypothetical protein
MKGLIPNEMFIATVIFILNGMFLSNVKCEEGKQQPQQQQQYINTLPFL